MAGAGDDPEWLDRDRAWRAEKRRKEDAHKNRSTTYYAVCDSDGKLLTASCHETPESAKKEYLRSFPPAMEWSFLEQKGYRVADIRPVEIHQNIKKKQAELWMLQKEIDGLKAILDRLPSGGIIDP